jgi:D-glycero-D-manno-heptose 1,7-bisphosphate phosphatase
MAFPKMVAASGLLDMIASLSRLLLDQGAKPKSLYCYHSVVNNAFSNSVPDPIRAVLLDRDGVVNEKMPEGRYVTRWDEFHVLPGAVEAIGMLNTAGIPVIVVSNQRGIALGVYTAEDVLRIHGDFQKLLEARGAHVDGFYFCPHDHDHNKAQCNCRKPLPGMFEQAVADFPSINAAGSVMIGDSISDIDFGRRLGMTTVFLEGDAERQKPGADLARDLASFIFPSLYEAVTGLLAKLTAQRMSRGTMCLGFPADPR